MGVLNVTPDSFSDGGRYVAPDVALRRAAEMLSEGATIIDVGGESTRPGAASVSEAEELDRVVPVIERLCSELDCIVSIDTMKPAVMRAACAAGAEIVNDVFALRAPDALAAVRESGAAAVLMHMRGEPRSMQQQPEYHDVVAEVDAFLAERIDACVAAGIPRQKLLIDPGFGFGKTLDHNLSLFAALDTFAKHQLPLLVGVSRKSMFGQLLQLPVERRMHAGVAAATLAVAAGAAVIRTHDVQATVDAVRFAAAIRQLKQLAEVHEEMNPRPAVRFAPPLKN
jgi:dihydropteroate synthase